VSKNRRRAGRGFSLVELMFVVAIAAVIAAVAIPSYNIQVRKNNRAVAKARLAQAAQLLERFYSDNQSYFVDVSGSNLVVGANSTQAGLAKLLSVPSGTTVYSGSNNESTSPYTLSISTTTANSYTLTATVVTTTQQAGDTKCMNLTLTNAGVKGISGTGTIADCW
jgi:type IV pilus assembly protein PilE